MPGVAGDVEKFARDFCDSYDHLLCPDGASRQAKLVVWKASHEKPNGFEYAELLFDKILELYDAGMGVEEATTLLIRNQTMLAHSVRWL
jgi:hypothetical protein